MKKIFNLLLFTVLAAGLAACSSDEEKTDVAGPAAGNLQIIMQTPQAAAGRGPVFFISTKTNLSLFISSMPIIKLNFT